MHRDLARELVVAPADAHQHADLFRRRVDVRGHPAAVHRLEPRRSGDDDVLAKPAGELGALRLELGLGARAILMAKNEVAGVYADDPRIDPDATFLPELTHLEAIERGLKVMDTTALSLCMDNNLPIYVFELAEGNIRRVVAGERVGTIISTPKKEDG